MSFDGWTGEDAIRRMADAGSKQQWRGHKEGWGGDIASEGFGGFNFSRLSKRLLSMLKSR